MDLTAIDRLACEYLKHEQLYRRGRSEITDQEFDAIEKELIRVAPDHPAFRCVESGRKLLSLGNQAPENWLKTLPENTKLIVQPKIDGVAIALRYVNGKLVKAWTRKGVDKTERIKLVDNIPKNIWNVDKVDSRLTYEIRGELFAPNREAAQSQRLAAGFLRKKFAKDAEGLSFVAYEILNWNCLFRTEKDVLDNLHQWCFETPVTWEEEGKLKHMHDLWLDGKFYNYELPSDGIVVKVADRNLQQKLGADSKCPNWALAIKNIWKTE